jgi:hypothetical protein
MNNNIIKLIKLKNNNKINKNNNKIKSLFLLIFFKYINFIIYKFFILL